MIKQIRQLSDNALKSRVQSLAKSKMIIERAHESTRALLNAFDYVRKARGGLRGGTTDEEQDLLRSMLVLSAAGLDSMIKQIIRDCLSVLVEKDDKVRRQIETFISRKIKIGQEDVTPGQAAKFLAHILVSDSPRKKTIEEYVEHLTGSSLQSFEELSKAVLSLGLEPNTCGIDYNKCRQIFDIRNKIIHELDINFSAPRRRHHLRKRDDMIDYANTLLSIAELIFQMTASKLS